MKRGRKEKKEESGATASVLIADITTLFHANLIACGVISPVSLRNWHATCRRFFLDWHNDEYITALLVDAHTSTRIVARRPMLSPLQHTEHCANLIVLDQMLMTLRLAKIIHQEVAAPGETILADVYADLATTQFGPGVTLNDLFKKLGDERCSSFLDTHALPDRLLFACRHLASLMAHRYGWAVEFARGRTWKGVGEDDGLLFGDFVGLSYMPGITLGAFWSRR